MNAPNDAALRPPLWSGSTLAEVPLRAYTDAELKAFVKEKLAAYKYPRSIEFLDELPKTATGKIQRFRLRERERAGASA